MDRRLINYLPPVLREVLEFQTINNANEPEIRLAWDAIAMVLANQFLDSATEDGVSIWERELLIYPKDTETLEFRKARIKAMWNLNMPFTESWLRLWLTQLCGPVGHKPTVNEYTIDIRLDFTVLPNAAELATEILKMLTRVKPANMLLFMSAFAEMDCGLTCGAHSEYSAWLEVWPLLVKQVEATEAVMHSTYMEEKTELEVWPLLIRSVEAAGAAVTKGGAVYETTMEIYPEGGVTNG